MIKLKKLGTLREVPFKQWFFPAGEVGVQIDDDISPEGYYVVHAHYPSSDDVFVALNLADALARNGVPKDHVELAVDYLPYSRQDRVCHPGESFALEVFLKVIGVGHFGAISTRDVHSQVGTDLIYSTVDEVILDSQAGCALSLPVFDWLIAPDKGAAGKVIHHQQVHTYATRVATLNKTRRDGAVLYDDYLHDSIQGTACVVDDICDGGATFLALADMLRRTQPNMTKLCLYVTHGIFSKGVDIVLEKYDQVFTANLRDQEFADKVTVLK